MTTIQAKDYLSNAQVDKLIEAGFVSKINWWVQDMTANKFINYTGLLGIEKVKGNTQLNLTFPEGTFAPGSEVKAGCGKWDVVDDNGKHCQQTAFFYIDQNGQAIPCKYRDLPSQNNGIVPLSPESEQNVPAKDSGAVQEHIAEPTNNNLTSPAPTPAQQGSFVVFPHTVACVKYSAAYSAYDVCDSFESVPDPKNDTRMCIDCIHHKNLYICE